MAGHSKWANIKHRKAAQDAKRGKIFTKLIREITVAAKLGGGVVEDNPRLRAAVDKALGSNMTRDTIDRAIKRGAGQDEADNLEEITYEGYAPGGVAILVECLTDNRNRTVADVRHAFTKFGGNLGTDGSVNYLFTKRGELYFPPGTDEDGLLEAGIEAGAEDVVAQEDGSIEVYTAPENYMTVKDAVMAAGFTPERSEVVMSPATTVAVDDAEIAGQIIKMLERLEDLDDVQNVYSNVDFSDDVLSVLE
jgi:YebC/PmpR family DNA-binding regulatory protein